MQNPFIISGPIPRELFCDRQTETETLAQHILNGRNVLLTSPRRVGKTGLILHTFGREDIADKYETIFFDILQTGCLRDFVFVFGKAVFDALKGRGRKALDAFVYTVRSLCGNLTYDSLTGVPKFSVSLGAIRQPETSLSEIFEFLNGSEKKCVVAIDEFQRICAYPEKNTEALLRTFIQGCGNAKFIFSGSERHILSRMFGAYQYPFYNCATPMHLDVIFIDRYREFIRRNFESAARTVDEDGIDMIYALVEGNTFCMQSVFNRAFSLTPKEGHCSKDSILTALRETIGANMRFYQSLLSTLPMPQKELLVAIAKEGHARKVLSGGFAEQHSLASASTVQKALAKLLESETVGYDDAGGEKTYFLNDMFLRLWILGFYDGRSEFI